jgi:hypothetical protein
LGLKEGMDSAEAVKKPAKPAAVFYLPFSLINV